MRLFRLAAAALAGVLLAACGSGGKTASPISAGAGGSGGSGVSSGGTGGTAGSGTGGNGGMSGQGGAGGSVGSLFQPAPGTTWQWQLSGLPIDTSYNVDVYDVDLFETTAQEMSALQSDGRIIICYFSAGSFETYRPDANLFPDNVKGNPLSPPFQDELWIDIRSTAVRDIMKARLDLAVQKACDAVEPDNVDGYTNNNGLGLTASDQLDYNSFIADEAHARGLSVGLKNDLDQLDALVGRFDWALNEECFNYNECDVYTGTFIAAGKAVFHAEYAGQSQLDQICAVTKPIGLSTILKNIQLDAWQVPCP